MGVCHTLPCGQSRGFDCHRKPSESATVGHFRSLSTPERPRASARVLTKAPSGRNKVSPGRNPWEKWRAARALPYAVPLPRVVGVGPDTAKGEWRTLSCGRNRRFSFYGCRTLPWSWEGCGVCLACHVRSGIYFGLRQERIRRPSVCPSSPHF